MLAPGNGPGASSSSPFPLPFPRVHRDPEALKPVHAPAACVPYRQTNTKPLTQRRCPGQQNAASIPNRLMLQRKHPSLSRTPGSEQFFYNQPLTGAPVFPRQPPPRKLSAHAAHAHTPRTRTPSPQPHSLLAGPARSSRTRTARRRPHEGAARSAQGLNTRRPRNPARPRPTPTPAPVDGEAPPGIPSALAAAGAWGPAGSAGLLPVSGTAAPRAGGAPSASLPPSGAHRQLPRRVVPEAWDCFPRRAGGRGRTGRRRRRGCTCAEGGLGAAGGGARELVSRQHGLEEGLQPTQPGLAPKL